MERVSGGIPTQETPSQVESYWIDQQLIYLRELLIKKNDDYRVTSGEFSNFYFASDVSGVNVRDIILAQIGIKIGRIKGLLNGLNRDVNFESLQDSINDLNGYATLLAAHERSMQG